MTERNEKRLTEITPPAPVERANSPLVSSPRSWAALPVPNDQRVLVDYRTADDAGVRARRGARARADGRLLHADRRRPVHLRADRRGQRAERCLCDGRAAADRARHRRLSPRMARHRRSSRRSLRGGLDKLQKPAWRCSAGTPFRIRRSSSATRSPARSIRRDLTNAGARPGDVLILTKPIGTGIIGPRSSSGAPRSDDRRRPSRRWRR